MTEQDHRKRPRRRGAALSEAIFRATLELIAERGYSALTMEGVAERASASKASLYRRWPSRTELALDAAYHVMPKQDDVPDTGSLRGDALALLRAIADLLAGPMGEAMRGILGDSLQDPQKAIEIRKHARGNTAMVMREIVSRAIRRGECRAEVATERRLEAGPAILRHHFVYVGSPIPDSLIVEIVDDVMLPLFEAENQRDA